MFCILTGPIFDLENIAFGLTVIANAYRIGVFRNRILRE